jgi:hypothetical protein
VRKTANKSRQQVAPTRRANEIRQQDLPKKARRRATESGHPTGTLSMTAPDRYPTGFFSRAHDESDAAFYSWPRLVTHIDDAAIAAVADL